MLGSHDKSQLEPQWGTGVGIIWGCTFWKQDGRLGRAQLAQKIFILILMSFTPYGLYGVKDMSMTMRI